MKGRAHAAEQRDLENHLQAWRTANYVQASKLKNFAEYLPKPADAPAVQPEVILDAMLTMQAHGVAMNVRRVDSPTALTVDKKRE
jgi:hypothetical protein